MKELKVNIKSHVTQIWDALVLLVCFLAVPFYIKHKHGDEYFYLSVTIFMAIFLVYLIIRLIFQYRCHVVNKNIKINPEKGGFELTAGSLRKTIKNDDIKLINLVMPKPIINNGWRILPTDSYAYAVVSLKDGSKIVVTSLLDPELYWTRNLLKEKQDLTCKLFCWPPQI